MGTRIARLGFLLSITLGTAVASTAPGVVKANDDVNFKIGILG